MKKLLILTTAALITTAAVTAQTSDAVVKSDIRNSKKQEHAIKKEDRKALRILKGTEVSYQAKAHFATDFNGIAATKWVRSTNFDEATFVKHGKTMTAYYDEQANLVGTTSDKAFTDIPVKAQQYIKKKYAGYKVNGVVFYDDNEANETDMVLYNQQFDDEDSYMVELQNAKETIVLHVNMGGDVGFFTKVK